MEIKISDNSNVITFLYEQGMGNQETVNNERIKQIIAFIETIVEEEKRERDQKEKISNRVSIFAQTIESVAHLYSLKNQFTNPREGLQLALKEGDWVLVAYFAMLLDSYNDSRN